MLFMKGSPQEPRCGFSRQIIGILDSFNADYKTFDILTDNDVREGLKKFSNWPTYPQVCCGSILYQPLLFFNPTGDKLCSYEFFEVSLQPSLIMLYQFTFECITYKKRTIKVLNDYSMIFWYFILMNGKRLSNSMNIFIFLSVDCYFLFQISWLFYEDS